MFSFFVVICGFIAILFMLFCVIAPELTASDFKQLKQWRMKLMGHCCANCNRYNKKTNCCTITFPAKRCWHEITGWYDTEETTLTRCAYYVIGSDDCHWKRKAENE